MGAGAIRRAVHYFGGMSGWVGALFEPLEREKRKTSDLPGSNRRPQDEFIQLQSRALPTELRSARDPMSWQSYVPSGGQNNKKGIRPAWLEQATSR